MVGLVVAVVLLAGALVAADGPLRGEVQRRVAADLRTSVPFTQTPTVTIEGYPFAWYAATGRFPSARVRAEGLPMRIEPHDVVLADVDVALTDVAYASTGVRARSVTGSARLTYADLSTLAGVPVAFADGRLRATYAAEVLGTQVRAVVSGVPSLDRAAQTVTLVDADVAVAGINLGRQASQGIIATLVRPVPLNLQYNLVLDAVSPAPDGLVVGFSGIDVTFTAR